MLPNRNTPAYARAGRRGHSRLRNVNGCRLNAAFSKKNSSSQNGHFTFPPRFYQMV
jgi:hypothetical protein